MAPASRSYVDLAELINHVFLPTRLPPGEVESRAWEDSLLELLTESLRSFHALHEGTAARLVHRAAKAIAAFRSSRDLSKRLSEQTLAKCLNDLLECEMLVPLQIEAQNAGVIIQSTASDVIFSVFELSPANSAVYSTSGRLRRHFPEHAISIPRSIFADVEFRRSISSDFAVMSSQSVEEMQPQIRKSNQNMDEDRDTTHPYIITKLFTAILEGRGGKQVDVTGVWKHTREEVMWSNGHRLPWRRSPVWLLLRVTLDLAFSAFTGDVSADSSLYKKFMAYFMSKIIECSGSNTTTDALFAMSAKLSRRLVKMSVSDSETWLSEVRVVLENTTRQLELRFTEFCQAEAKSMKVSALDMKQASDDTLKALPTLEPHLENIASKKTSFLGDYSPETPSLLSFDADELPSATLALSSQSAIDACNLASIEDWAGENLNTWLEHRYKAPETCGDLFDLIQRYHAAAVEYYSGKPEGMSIMFLTILELWIACDKAAIKQIPFLAEYAPDVEPAVWSSLVLPRAAEMKRLSAAEAYLSHRLRAAKVPRSALFGFGTPKDFGPRYFSQSRKHQDLLVDIELKANGDREAKGTEFAALSAEYKKCMEKYKSSECEYINKFDEYQDYVGLEHSSRCKRCGFQARAKALRIAPHEWPLPRDKAQAQAAVFELQIPYFFGCWRDCTRFIIHEVLDFSTAGRRPEFNYALSGYSGLSKFYQMYSSAPVIEVLSEVKPHDKTHRKSVAIELASEEDIYLNTGPVWKLYDSRQAAFLNTPEPSIQISKACTIKLGPQSKSLQPFLTRPWNQIDGKTPNSVIAGQSESPHHLTVDEFKPTCALALGPRIIWCNLLTQLAMPLVDLNKAEILAFVWQAALQAGQQGKNWRRESHEQLADDVFIKTCLSQLDSNLAKARESWELRNAVALLTLVGSRLLSVGNPKNALECLNFLSECRDVSYQWQSALRAKALASSDQDIRADLARRAHEAALICLLSFDVDTEHLRKLLQQEEPTRVYLECLMTLRDTDFCVVASVHLDTLTLRSRRLAHRCQAMIRDNVIQNKNGDQALDLAIRSTWTSFQRSTTQQWEEEALCWLRTQASGLTPTSQTLTVHFNIVTGELLVNGLPRGRLPSSYETHEDYRALFGYTTVDCMPTTEPGMLFAATKPHRGYLISIALNGTSLLVRARKEDKAWTSIARSSFKSVLPSTFTQDFVFWYNMDEAKILLCPKETPWNIEIPSWTLTKVDSRWSMVQSGSERKLIFPWSETADRYAAIFAPLEDNLGLQILLSEQLQSLQVQIPRLQLDFWVDAHSSRMMSRQYKGMRVDDDQTIGTLHGLKSKLVLVQSESTLFPERLCLIPNGEPATSLGAGRDHATVMIGRDADAAHPFYLDESLGALKGNGSLAALLSLAELHALTSGWLPDHLTGCTGVEQALEILESAAVRSLELKTRKELCLLDRIRRLSPQRTFYPRGMRVMQSIAWDNALSVQSQSDMFSIVAERLYADTTRLQSLRPTNLPPLQARDSVPKLSERAVLRSCMVSTIWKHPVLAEEDKAYERNSISGNDLESRRRLAVRFGHALCHGEAVVEDSRLSVDASVLYQLLSSSGVEVKGSNEARVKHRAQYDAKLLKKPAIVLAPQWCGWHRSLTLASRRLEKTRLVAWIATLAFAKSTDLACLQTLLAIAAVSEISRVETMIPSNPVYDLHNGFDYSKKVVEGILRASSIDFYSSDQARLPKKPLETNRAVESRRRSEFNAILDRAVQSIEQDLQQQWPCLMPNLTKVDSSLFSSKELSSKVQNTFKTWFNNRKFKRYLDEVCAIVKSTSALSFATPQLKTLTTPYEYTKGKESVSLIDVVNLFHAPDLKSGAQSTGSDSMLPHYLEPATCVQIAEPPGQYETSTTSNHLSPIRLLSQALSAKASSPQELRYVVKLHESIACLEAPDSQAPDASTEQPQQAETAGIIRSWAKIVTDVHKDALFCLTGALHLEPPGEVRPGSHVSSTWDVVSRTYHWPRITCRNLLALIRFSTRDRIPTDWKKAIIALGESIVDVHTASRMSKVSQDPRELLTELKNTGQRVWDPMEYPDSLLLEIEGKLRIRRVQSDIAMDMIDPPQALNAVMQLNMGEGKSSVIVPMTASHLADGKKLVRVIVAKPQAPQMKDVLVSKLGGLMDRQVFHMPLSRSVRLTQTQAEILLQTCRQCMREGGVMLVQPEHILSCQLMTIEMPIRKNRALGNMLYEISELFQRSARDIVDESDENFACKLENIYTMGDQRGVEHAPDRWLVIQQVLELVSRQARLLKPKFPKGIEVNSAGRPSFPILRFLDEQAAGGVLNAVSTSICEKGMFGFPVAFQSEEMRAKLREYIVARRPSTAAIDSVEGSSFWKAFRSNLLLLRGLFASDILLFVFGAKRWRVNYGLDANRTPGTRLAVPYRAKDSPSLRSEFSQPDVVISLTCLSYYYGGLTNEDLTLALEHLYRTDQADVEYERWVATSDGLSEGFQRLASINLRDRDQCETKVFPCFRYSKGAVDYFLCHIVFTKEMKEFPYKLSASGWDLGSQKHHPVTGFSGTNDSQHVLPIQVAQLERADQIHTNALVLGHLLRSENSVLCLTAVGFPGFSRSCDLLELVAKLDPETRVILDVGALVLDLHNEEVAREWLIAVSHREEIQAAVFCDSSDEICVVDRRGYVERLSTSPFSAQLDRCLVFLDESHTRGIDLKLPAGYRAAVTLGASLTKDRLIQACMRMRKLANDHSVVFIVPEEIETKIYRATGKEQGQAITVADVLQWSVQGTWEDLRRSIPLWMNQGVTFAKQAPLWNAARADTLMSESTARKFLEPEAQTLEERYRPRGRRSILLDTDSADASIISKIKDRCAANDGLDIDFGALQEEQERELAPEIEQEKQVERPESAGPAAHFLHRDVTRFVQTGVVKHSTRDSAFQWAFESFRNTVANGIMPVTEVPKGLLVTKDFARTIEETTTTGLFMDSFQRSVQWILTDRLEDDSMKTMVVISPYEADRLMHQIRESKHVVLHLYAPRHNKAFESLDGLKLYNIPACPPQAVPPHLEAELTLFSGGLYFETFQHYVRACKYLGLTHVPAAGDMKVGADGFIEPPDDSDDGDGSTVFRQSPTKFFQAIMTRIRRQCETIDKTHMGRLLSGELLTEEDFSEVVREQD